MNVGVGDVVMLSQLAFKCYKICKESSEQFQRIATEVSSLRSTLDEVQEAIEENQPLSPTRQERVNEGIRSCHKCLVDLEGLLHSYESMYTQRQRVFDRLRFGVKDIADMRSRIISHTTSLGVMNQAITNEGLKKINIRLRKLCAEHKAGHRQGSVISSRSGAASDIFLTDWDEVKREVEDIGIPGSAIDANKAYIQQWIKEAMEAGEFDEDPEKVHRGAEAPPPAPFTPTTLPSESPEAVSPRRERGSLAAPSTLGFRSSEPTIVGDNESHRPSELDGDMIGPSFRPSMDDDMVGPFSRPSMDDEPPVRVSLEAGPSVSRKGTDLFATKWREIAGVTGGDPEAPIDLRPNVGRRKSSGISSLMFKLFSSNQRIIQAASDGDAVEVQRLLSLGVDVNTKDKWGWTAMSMAAYGGHEEVARVVIAAGATLDHEDVDKDTPYTLAFNRGHRNLVMMIEETTTRRATEAADTPEVSPADARKTSTVSLKKWKTR